MKVLVLILIFISASGCNHWLYPAQRGFYFEARQLKPAPSEIKIPVTGGTENEFLHAWYFPSRSEAKKGIVVHFHGNGENLSTHFMFFNWVIDYGYDYLIFDYRGYGRSSGEQAQTELTVKDGISVFNYVFEKYPQVPVVAVGQSLGSNVMLRALQELNGDEKTRRLLPKIAIFDSSFNSYKEAASSTMSQRWFLYPLKPLSYLVISDQWSAARRLEANPEIPAVFYHGDADTIIQYDLGRENFDKWRGPKVFVMQKGGGHTSAFGDKRFQADAQLSFLNCVDAALKGKSEFSTCGKVD